jgi:hypothetical protein
MRYLNVSRDTLCRVEGTPCAEGTERPLISLSFLRAYPAVSYRAAASSTVSVYACSSAFAAGRDCSSMLVG